MRPSLILFAIALFPAAPQGQGRVYGRHTLGLRRIILHGYLLRFD
jgi:hypothetical protein